MLNHISKCDCSFCVPPTELLNSPSARGNWSKKEDLIPLRIKQEREAITDLTSLIKSHNAGTRGSRNLLPSTKVIVDGIMTRSKRNVIVFNTREVQLALLAWRHHMNQDTTPSTQLSIFVKSALEIYATDEAKKAAKKLESKRNKRKDPESHNPAEFENDVTKSYYGKATLIRLSNDINSSPEGTFHFEFGCAVFYPKPSDGGPKVVRHAGRAQSQQAQEMTIERPVESRPTENNLPPNFSSGNMQMNLRLKRLEAHLGIQEETLFIDSPPFVDRVAALESEIQALRASILKPQEPPTNEARPSSLFEPDFMY